MKKVAIIGAGIFGLCAALELSKFCEVKVFERNDDLLTEATSNNMLRHHMGYHYPRSDETVYEIKAAAPSFEKEFPKCIIRGFPAYYSIVKEGSMTSPEDFLKFCQKHKLPYEIVDPDDWLIDKSRISLCVRTPEAVYDPEVLKRLVRSKLDLTSVNVYLGHEVVDGWKADSKKGIKIKSNEGIVEEEFDIIVNATYSYFNMFNKWFHFPTPVLQYDLMEILEIKLPLKEKFGMLVLDGQFCTTLPKGESDTYTLGHVHHTMVHRTIAEQMEEVQKTRKVKSNKEKILFESSKYMPIMKEAKYIRSLFSTRVIKANHQHDDARPTEITDYGDGLYSIFAGKVITAVKTARDLAEKINNE
ncbi:MAG: FAD-dependent oxidoreductase [archaeon]